METECRRVMKINRADPSGSSMKSADLGKSSKNIHASQEYLWSMVAASSGSLEIHIIIVNRRTVFARCLGLTRTELRSRT